MDNWTLSVRVQEIWECWSAACEDKRQRGVEFNPSGIQQGLLLGFCFKPISSRKKKILKHIKARIILEIFLLGFFYFPS